MPTLSNNDLQITITAIDKASSILKNVQNEVKNVGDQAGRQTSLFGALGDSGKQAFGLLSTGAKTFGAIVGAATVATLGFGLKSGEQLQTTAASFRALTGDAKTAQGLFQNLYDFARGTPFAFPDVADAGRTLLGYGRSAQQVQGDVRILGGLVATTGADWKSLAVVYGQVNAAGRLYSQDALQLIQNGVPITTALAKKLGISISDVKVQMEKGLITADQFNAAMSDLVPADAIEKLSGTMKGALSNLTGSLRVFAFSVVGIDYSKFDDGSAILSKQGGIFDEVRKIAIDFSKFMSSPEIKAAGSTLGNSLGGAMRAAREAFEKETPKIKTMVADSIGKFADSINDITKAFDSGGFKAVGKKITESLKSIDINSVIGSLMGQFANFPWEQHSGELVNGFIRMLEAFAGQTETFVARAVPSLLKIAVGLINGLIVGIINAAIQNPLDFAMLLLALGFLPVKVLGALGVVLSKIPLVGPIAEWVVTAMKIAADWVTAPIKGFFSGVGDVMVKSVGAGWNSAVGWLKGLVTGGLDGIRASVNGMFEFVKNFNWGAAIGGAAKGIGNALVALLEGGINGALSGLPGSPKIHLPRFARGTNFAPGGLALVGEEGPELVNLPRGSQVKTAAQTRQALSGGGSGAKIEVTQNIYNQVDYDRGIAELGFRLRAA
jgi:tape measure domain-containing protein